MSDWALVVAASISAPVAAVAALGGAWLQGHLSRQAEAEADARRTARDHAAVVRAAVVGLLGALDIAAQAGSQLIYPPQKSIGRTPGGGVELETDEQAFSEHLAFARESITTALSKMNEIKVLEPELLPDSATSSMREIAGMFSLPTHFVNSTRIGGAIEKIYALHSEIATAHGSWLKSPENSLQLPQGARALDQSQGAHNSVEAPR